MWHNVQCYIKSNDHLAKGFRAAYQLKMNKLIDTNMFLNHETESLHALVGRIVAPKDVYALIPWAQTVCYVRSYGKGTLRLPMGLSSLIVIS